MSHSPLAYALSIVVTIAGTLACTAPTADPVGHWIGTTGRVAPGLESNRVEIHITGINSERRVFGTILFGEPGVVAPPTDPSIGYPESMDEFELQYSLPDYVRHFTYPVRGTYIKEYGLFEGGKDTMAAWDDWCKLQTSHYFGGRYDCLPDCGATTFREGEEVCILSHDCGELSRVEVDCGQYGLCINHGVCTCDEDGCRARSNTQAQTLTLTLDGDRLSGSFSGLGTGTLERQ